jgi:hypothetical protein
MMWSNDYLRGPIDCFHRLKLLSTYYDCYHVTASILANAAKHPHRIDLVQFFDIGHISLKFL